MYKSRPLAASKELAACRLTRQGDTLLEAGVSCCREHLTRLLVQLFDTMEKVFYDDVTRCAQDTLDFIPQRQQLKWLIDLMLPKQEVELIWLNDLHNCYCFSPIVLFFYFILITLLQYL